MEGDRKPMLLYFTGKTLNTHSFCSLSNPSKCYSIWNTDPELKESKLLTIQHGWYLWQNNISNYVSNLFLWNPSNLNKIILPPLQHNDTISSYCILSSPPSVNHQTCSIYLFSSHSPSIFYCQLGDQQWTKVCFYNQIVRVLATRGISPLEGRKTFFMNPVYCNGCVYARMCCIIVVIQKLQPNRFTINCTPDIIKEPPPTYLEQLIIIRLIACNNVLYLIKIFKMLGRVSAVYVHKFDCSQQVWEKVESLKDKNFFVSSLNSAFACQATNPEGGRIYIALSNYNFVFIYNIEDNCIMISQPFSNLSKKRSNSRWVMPDTRMADNFKQEIGKFHQIREKKSICDADKLKDAEDKANNVSVLSQDMVQVIAKHINDVLDYLHFRASNKFFLLAAPHIQWRSSSSMSRFDDHSMCPLFVFSNEKVFTFVNPKHGLDYKYNINFPQYWSLNSKICCSKEGWLLLVAVDNNRESQGFFNPFTKQVLPLPIGEKPIMNNRCVGMSHSPTSYECVVVEYDKLSSSDPMETVCVHRLGDNFFGLFSFEERKLSLCNVSPVFHNGSFYFLTITGKLAVLQVTGEIYTWKQLEEPESPFGHNFNNFLVECDGNLLAVLKNDFAYEVEVFKLNESTMTWVEVESLENHMIFIGKTSFSAVASIPGMENKIYFPRFYEQSIVFYSLETNKYHTFQHDQVVDFHHWREHLNGTWIQPRWD
ncbi:uncharacterized protein LOC131596308 isoform X2 [Vicia villosa]|nr:uncharacterized protein LOC131596308 isoform X2 [Vicia villosa]XP_058724905.1 uncharacterized protein LOC131596308 isoform X2 [Vicia villosa]